MEQLREETVREYPSIEQPAHPIRPFMPNMSNQLIKFFQVFFAPLFTVDKVDDSK